MRVNLVAELEGGS